MSSLFRIARNSQLLRSMFVEASSDLTLLRGMSFKAGVSAAFPGSTEATIPTAYSRVRPDGNPGIKIYAPYTVYKGKAALAAEMILPKFNRLKSGSYRLERSGGVMLTLWPAIGERKYNWEKRQLFSLSATEVGSLISLGSKESCEFFHDPAMKSSNAGQIRKTLSIKAHDDGSGYFITLGVMNNVLRTNDRLTVPVSTAEFAVLRSACTFALPHLLGWDKHSNQLPSSNSESSYRSAAPAIPSLEWDR